MATFKFGRAIDLHWNGYDIQGPAETVFSIPDQLYEEFNADIAPVEPTLVWIDTNEFNTLSELNNKVYYQTAEPTSSTLTVGDLWVDSDATINGAISSIIATSPISSSLNTSTAAVTLSAISASTSSAGVVQLSDSVSTTSSVLAATPTAVKSAYDLASTAIQKSTVTAKGDIIVASGSSAVSRLAIGTDGQILTADSTSSTGIKWSAQSSSGVISVGGTSPISTSGTTAITVAVSAASTSAAGVVQLIDSANSTSTTTAATPNSVLTAVKNIEKNMFNSATIIGNYPRYALTSTTTTNSGVVFHLRIIPNRDFTVNNISFICQTAGVGLTLVRFGIYTRSGTTFTLVARTASDSTIFNLQNTRYTRALDTTGGYPATYSFTAGTEYWISAIQVGTTGASYIIAPTGFTGLSSVFGYDCYQQSAQTDLPTSSTGVVSNLRPYAEVS